MDQKKFAKLENSSGQTVAFERRSLESVRAVIFDVDGVLISVLEPDGQFAWQKHIEADLGISRKIVESFFQTYWRIISTGATDTVEAWRKHLSVHELSISADEILRYWHERDSNVDSQMFEAAKTLKAKGYMTFLGTNQERYRAYHLWNNLDFKSNFNDIFASCFIGHEKPSELFYREVQAKIGVGPSEILFIDDTESHIIAARTCGWKSYHHRDFETTYSEVLFLL